MKNIVAGLVAALIVSGATWAGQSEEQKKGSPMQGMMQEMMKGEQSGKGSMEGMGDMDGMMQMMRMMNQCAAMMEKCCPATKSDKAKDVPKE